MALRRDVAVRVRVPATSANLGPGFDCLGLALQLHDEVEVRVVDGDRVSVLVDGEGAGEVPTDHEHLVARAVRTALSALGQPEVGLALACTNRLPHGRGLGSSAGAIVAGLVAGRALVDGGSRTLDDDALLALGSAMEGHPDNVAACLLGGATIAWTPQGRAARAVRVLPHLDLVGVVLVPPTRLATEAARDLLPASVPHADAAASAGRAALLVEALTHRPDLLLDATEDRLHQAYREPAMPESLALVAALRRDGVPAVVSGAGPTVLALVASAAAEAVAARAPAGWRALVLAVDTEGATLLPQRMPAASE